MQKLKILIVKTSALGDVIQCFPALDFLRRQFPSATIDWVVEKPFAELLHANPHINHVYEVETKKWKKAPFRIQSFKQVCKAFKSLRESSYDLVIDLQGNIKSGLITLVVKGKEKVGFSRACAPEWPNTLFTSFRVEVDLASPVSSQYLTLAAAFFSKQPVERISQVELMISKEEEEWIQKQLSGVKERPIMVCMGSNWENKKLSLSTWQAFLQKVQDKYSSTFFFVWGSEKEREEVEELHQSISGTSFVLPRMILPVWQRMMGHMEIILSVDSSALHLAATTSSLTYSFFGPSSAEVYNPSGASHGTLQGSCPYEVKFTKRCPKLRTCATGACLKNFTAEEIFEQFSTWAQENGGFV